MAPVAHHDIDVESHTSGQDSPLRRQFSEPMHPHSTSTQDSPAPVMHKVKCDWCGKYFETPEDDAESQSEALKEHIASVHPHIAKFAMYDGAADDEAEDSHLNDSDENDEYEDGDEPEAEGDGDGEGEGEGHEAESDLALSNQLHEFSREEDSVSVEKRLHNLWNIHDPCQFSKEYNETTVHLDQSWENVFRDPKRTKKRGASEILGRPAPYKKSKVNKGEYLEITPLEDLLVQLRDPETRSVDELYAITENVAHALKAWQDEHLAIDKLHKLATRHNAKPTTDPRKLDRPEVYQDKKEAMLYGYKHDPREDKVRNQNPFTQGGFKPTPAQARKMLAKAGPNNLNPDGWPAIKKNGVDHVPMFQNPPREEFVGKATRKRKAAEMEASRPTEADDAALEETPATPEAEEPMPKRRTRGRRVTTEADQTEPASAAPASTRGSGRGRGRGRGRGGSRLPSRAASETPQPATPAPAVPARSTGRGASSAKSTTNHVPLQAGPALAPANAAQSMPIIEPAPSSGPALAPPSTQVGTTLSNETIDPVELARREKIANSKNPKRTEAMLNHWARFNREGRIRNPKRTKVQIEAARVADAAKKATEPPKTVGRKKSSPVFGGPRDAGIAPAPAPAPAPTPTAPPAHSYPSLPPPSSASLPPPGPPGPHHPQLAPIPPPPSRGSIAPYAPIDPRAVAPFPSVPGPYGPLQQPPPQIPYQTPYPEHFMPFGATAAPGLPPPGHTRPA
ncbi:hypothetical protein ASPWEDRAFT_103267 [Aspergillus wentii DTO 134E9]|uniref:Uncharacterized protein n=1 Tax=Aspergillus wentii DTO 134E9 TaxID=1073089 RepID=A0A1L9RX37_ASPWE|nr:uncharacterized protein ASPWEDRAFT_103267 [Aspergillus wentii DTO 134E9]OJJ39492.1 hypothetical protein ASPWEDRAFT_103267 [Aspergillus wentii DTO 134E9]